MVPLCRCSKKQRFDGEANASVTFACYIQARCVLQVLLLIWEGRLPHWNQAHWGMDSTQQPVFRIARRLFVAVDGLCALIESPARWNSWLTWLVLSSSCERNVIGRRERSNNWTQRLPRSMATHTGGRLELGTRFQQQEGRGSRLPSVRDGQRCGGVAGRSRTSSPCPRRKPCRLLLEEKLPQHRERDGRRSKPLKGSRRRTRSVRYGKILTSNAKRRLRRDR